MTNNLGLMYQSTEYIQNRFTVWYFENFINTILGLRLGSYVLLNCSAYLK